jgi:hypothetical protein
VSMGFPSKSFEVAFVLVLCQRRDVACRLAKAAAATSRL